MSCTQNWTPKRETDEIKNKTLYFQAGAGIVADSIPKNEYDETKNKSKAMLNAIRKSLNNE